MFWGDGSVYKGFWDKGVQSTLGIMVFPDGLRVAGFFEQNIYKKPLSSMVEFEQFEKSNGQKIPVVFRQEIIEYLK